MVTMKKPWAGTYAMISKKAAEWGMANGYEQLLKDVMAFKEAYATTGPGDRSHTPTERYKHLTPDALSKLYMKYQRLTKLIEEVQHTN